MKYDDDELAEAALLLAYNEAEEAERPAPPMPAALEKKILAQGRSIASDVRYSTTKAGALALEAEERPPEPAVPARAWIGWLAAAACFAFAVYQWRLTSLEREAMRSAASSSLAAAPLVEARDPDGKLLAALYASPGSAAGEVRVARLPASVAGEEYRVWLSPGDARSAVPAGSFACAEECRQLVFSVSAAGRAASLGSVDATRSLWLTRNKTSDPWSLEDLRPVIGEGHGGPR